MNQEDKTSTNNESVSNIDSSNQQKIEVFLRLKPQKNGSQTTVVDIGPRNIHIANPLRNNGNDNHPRVTEYQFDCILPETSTQSETFKKSCPSLLRKFLDGENALLFSYGPSGSGKTYTIQGKKNQSGILQRLLQSIFRSIDEDERKRNGDLTSKYYPESILVPVRKDMKFTILISYLECYNERIYDLLKSPTNGRRTPLSIKEDKNKHIFIKDLLEQPVKSFEQAMKWLDIGLKNRKVGQTYINRDSSRSHSIFTIKLAQIPKNVPIEEVRKNPSLMVYSKFSIVDLAGSERGSKSRVEGNRMREAGNINNSLMILGKCLEIMRHNQYWEGKEGSESKIKMIPFRESKLTRLFQDFFLGNGGKAVMIVNVNTDPSDYDQTTQALSFATTAKHVIPTIRKQQTSTKIDKDEVKPIPFLLGGNDEDKKENKLNSNIKHKNLTKEMSIKQLLIKKKKKVEKDEPQKENKDTLINNNHKQEINEKDNKENDKSISNKDMEMDIEDQNKEIIDVNNKKDEEEKIKDKDEYNIKNENSSKESYDNDNNEPSLLEIYSDNNNEEQTSLTNKSISYHESITPSKTIHYNYTSPLLIKYSNLDQELMIRSEIADEHSQYLSETQKYYQNHYEDKMVMIIEMMKEKIKKQTEEMDEYIQFQEEMFIQELKMRDNIINELNQKLNEEKVEREKLKANLDKKEELFDELKIKYQKKITKFKEDIIKLNDEYKKQLEATRIETESLKKLINEQKSEKYDEEEKDVKQKITTTKKRKSTSISQIESETDEYDEDIIEDDEEDIENNENQTKPKKRGRPRKKRTSIKKKKTKTEESEDDEVESPPKRKLKRLKKMKEVLSPTNGIIPTKTPLRKRLRPRKVNPLAFSPSNN